MISKLLVIFALIFSSASYAKATKIESCNINTLGGIDLWPWRQAQPFPWSNIQGTWQVMGEKEPMYFVFKIAKDNTTRKIIDTRVYVEGRACNAPIAKGIAYIYANAKNTVRAQMSDGQYKYSIKLAMFNTTDLNIDSADCGDSVLGASKQVIGTNPPIPSFEHLAKSTNVDNFLLKKVSPLLEYICK